MDDSTRDSAQDPSTLSTMGRRTFFGRVFLATGGTALAMGLAGCPGGDQDDDDDDEGDDD